MAAAWLDERDRRTLSLARGVGRPLWLGRSREGLFFASTPGALELVERALRIDLRLEEIAHGRLLHLVGPRIARTQRFRVARYREANVLPAVRAPHEGAWCLERLISIASLA